MNRWRTLCLKTGLETLHAMGVFRLLAPFTRGRGVIFTLHHVLPARHDPFQPNRILEVTPDFLDQAVGLVRTQGYDIIPIGEVPARLADPDAAPFAVFTFDDGYRDNLDHAYPVMKRHGAPFTIYVATGLPDGTAVLWWRALEEILRAHDRVALPADAGDNDLPARTTEEKYRAYEAIYWRLRAMGEDDQRTAIDALCRRYGHDPAAYCRSVSLTWDEIRRLADDPLVTIGAHTVSHPALAKLERAEAVREIDEGRAELARSGAGSARHLAYPYGSPREAGAREFALCGELGFATGVTTRPGVLRDAHRDHLGALPRVSLNGDYQKARFVRMFLSGAPFALAGRFRQLDVA